MALKPRDLGKARKANGQVATEGRLVFITGGGKVGGTAGWVPGGAANNLGTLGTQAAGTTGATLVVPVPALKAGSRIQGGHLIGQGESAGNTATLTWALRKRTAVAADNADALVEDMAAALSITADTLVSSANTAIPAIDELVVDGTSYYVLITGTTAASTDWDILAIALRVLEEPADLVEA